MRKIINGKPVIVISPNGIEYDNMKNLNMNINDLTEALRNMNYFSLDQIQYAIVETNGKISVLPNADNSPICASDLKLKKEDEPLPIILISEGKFVKENLKISKIQEEQVKKIIMKNGVYNVKDVVVLTLDKNGKGFIQGKHMPSKSFESNYKVGG